MCMKCCMEIVPLKAIPAVASSDILQFHYGWAYIFLPCLHFLALGRLLLQTSSSVNHCSRQCNLGLYFQSTFYISRCVGNQFDAGMWRDCVLCHPFLQLHRRGVGGSVINLTRPSCVEVLLDISNHSRDVKLSPSW
jgi:hypothetical protein